MDTTFVCVGSDAYYGASINSRFWPNSSNNYALDNLFTVLPARKFPFESLVPQSGLHVFKVKRAGYYQEPVLDCVAEFVKEVLKSISNNSSRVVLANATCATNSPFFDNRVDEIISVYSENYLQKWRYDLQFAFQILTYTGLEC